MGCVTVHECECVCRGRSLGPRGHSFGILLSAPEGTNPLPSCWVPTDKALVAPKRSKSHTPLARQLHRAQQPSRLCHRLGRDEPPERPRPPFPHRPPPRFPGPGGWGLPTVLSPSCSGCCCFCSGAATAAAGARCRSRRRGCGRAGDSTVWEPSAGPVCAIELLIHRKKGGREKKEVTCPSYTYAKRSSRRREKLRRPGGGGRKRSSSGSGGGGAEGGGGVAGDRHPPV